jgi:hypothetical protein
MTTHTTASDDVLLLMSCSHPDINGAMEQCRVLAMTKRDLELRSYPLPSSTAANSHSSSSIVVLLIDGRFYELQAVELQQQGSAGRGRYYGSWFIDQRVCSSGTIYLASIFDPR